MSYLGNFAAGITLNTKFTTVDTTGAPTVLSGGAISVYKNNSTTQSTAGVTFTGGFDSVVGLNNVNIDLSADGTFYAAGGDFQIVITTGTVGGTSVVGYVVGEFSIQNRYTGANVIQWNSTNVTTPDTAGSPKVTVTSGTGDGQLDFTSGVVKANLAQILASAITGTAAQLAAAFTKWFNVAAPTGTVNSLPDAVAGAASGVAIVGSAMNLAANALTASALDTTAVTEITSATNTALSTTHGPGSWEGGGGAPTVEEIDAELTANHGAGAWNDSGGIGTHPYDDGPYQDADTSANIAGGIVEARLSEDPSAEVVATGTTDLNGEVTLYFVAAGTAWVWFTAQGYQPIGPLEIEVV